MRRISFLIVTSFFSLISSVSYTPIDAFEVEFVEIKQNSDWEEVLTRAKKNQNLIFLNLFTDWCETCKILNEQVFTDANLGSHFNNSFVNAKIDAESDFGQVLVNQLSISVFPTLLFISPDMKTFERIEGQIQVKALAAYAKQASANWQVWPELASKEKVGKLSKEDYRQLISIKEKMDVIEAADLANDYISLLAFEDYQEIENIWLLSRYQNTLESIPYQFINSNKERIIGWHGEREYYDYLSAVYNDNLNLSIKYGDQELMERLITEVLPDLVQKDGMPKAIFSTRSVYYAQRQEFQKYHMEINGYLNNHLSRGAKIPFILSTAYEILEDYSLEENLSFVDQLLTQGLRINSKSFEVTSLLGYVKALQKNFFKANELLKTADQLATDEEEQEMVNSLKEAVELLRNGN